MNKKDQEIERKLQELERELESAQLKSVAEAEETRKQLGTASSSTDLTVPKKNLPAETSIRSDLCYFGGIGLLITGLFMLFNHVHVGTPMLSMFGLGGQGAGLMLIPLLAGIGWLIYDSKNKYAWLLSAAACGLIFFSILSGMTMTFPSTSLLGTLLMLAPFAVGGA
ncbi:MAG TPA: hypothetical protein V6C72_07205, partial [Chroococcales cyanobacterium]